MAHDLKGKRIAVLFTEGVEQVELTEPLGAVRGAGAETELISLRDGEVQMFNHLDKGTRSWLTALPAMSTPRTTTDP
jgi:deglycase